MIIWLASYPRSGNTFFRVLLNRVFVTKTHSIYDDKFDIGADKNLSNIVGHEFLPDEFTLDWARRSDETFILKTHDYPSDVCDGDKAIYLLRDGRESVLSYYSYHRDYTDQKKCLLDIIAGDTQFGGWGEHVLAWAPCTRPDTLLVKFEELISDPLGQVDRISEFTGLEPVSDSLPTFEELHTTGPRFFRSGKTDSWKKVFSEYDHHAFWLRNYAQMIVCGYERDMPELFRRNPAPAAYLSGKQLAERLLANDFQVSLPPSGIGRAAKSLAEAICRQGELLFQKGDLEGAESRFLEAIRHAPGFADGYNNLGVLCWQKGEAEQALEYLTAGLRLAPEHGELISNALEVRKSLGREQAARRLRERHIESSGNDMPSRLDDPRTAETEPAEAVTAPSAGLVSVGEAAYMAGDTKKAEVCFLDAYATDNTDIAACNNLVVVYWESGDVEQALRYLDVAMGLDSTNRDVVVNGGQILSAYGYKKEAAGLYETYLAIHQDDREVLALYEQVESAIEVGALMDTATAAVGQATTKSGHNIECVDFSLVENRVRAPKISIVIPSFNQGAYLETTIRSVLDQNYPNLELIVMDGGSRDNSVDIIKRYEDRISYWQSQPDDGQYWAVNEGFRRSSGELMAWINSDDKLHPKSLHTMASIFTQRRDVDWVTGRPNVMNEQGFITWICEPVPVFSQRNYLQKKYDFPSFIQQEGTFWRRSLWETAGATLQTDLQMAGDLELWARFFRSAALHTTTVCTGCFRQQKDQKTANAMALYREEADKILDREIAMFTAMGKVAPAPVEPLSVQWATPPEPVAPELVHAFQRILPPTSDRMHTHSVMPGMRQSAKTGNAMHGARVEPLVTAIVSTYNSEKYLRACLDDLEAQTMAERLEVVVVDSGSLQNEAAIVREYQGRYPNIRYIRTESRETIYSAWNRAIEVARGRYLTNANTDDHHRADALERMVNTLEADPGVALVYADAAATAEENASFAHASVTGSFRWPEFDARHLFSVCYVGPQPMWRRELHDKYGHFDPRMRVAGDYEFWLRIAPHERFQHIPEVLGLYLDSKASIEHALAAVGSQESELARERNWPASWGQRPPLSAGYFVAAGDENSPLQPGEQLQEKNRQGVDPGTTFVSVIMATKNRREMLECALYSVIQQTYQAWEIVLINDGGENVRDIIERLGLEQRVRYLQNARSIGQAKARNKALQTASGEIIVFLDDDDLYLPDHLQTVVAAFQDTSCVFAYTDADVVQEVLRNGQRREVSRSAAYRHGAYSRRKLHIDNYIPINTWAVRKCCLDEVGGFDESLSCCEDWELLLRIAQQHEFVHLERTTVEVRHRADVADNVTRQKLSETEAVYETIYARYAGYGDQDIREGRSRAIAVLREKLANLQETAEPGLPATAGSGSGETGVSAADGRHMRDRQRFIDRTTAPGYHCPAIHLFAVVDSGNVTGLADTLAALGDQFYSGWGMTVISTLGSPGSAFDELPMLEWQQAADPASALREAMSRSVGEWVGVLSAGDRLAADALSTVVDYVNQNPGWQFIYSDEGIRDSGGAHGEAHFKPDFNLDYLLAYPYLGNFCLVRKEAKPATGAGARHTQSINLELCLQVVERSGEASVGHIPAILSKRAVDVVDVVAADGLHCEYEKVISGFLQRMNIDADLVNGVLPDTFMVDYRLCGRPRVCIAIYAVGSTQKAAQTVASILNKTGYADYSVRVAVDDRAGSVFDECVDPRIRLDCVHHGYTRTDFLNAIAAEQGSEYLILMEPGTLVVQEVWLERMLAQGSQGDVGALGVRLVSPEQRIVHDGIITGVGSFSAGSIAFQGHRMDDPGYMNRAQVPQVMSAVSSGCMLISAQVFQQVGGFDRAIDVPLYQDIDLCQRLRACGKKTVWTPYVTMLYVGEDLGAYRGKKGLAQVREDAETLASRWLTKLARDPAYNPNMGLKELDFAVDRQLPTAWNPDIHDLPRIVGFGTGSYGSWQYRAVQPMNALRNNARAYCVQTPFIHKNMILLPTVAEIARIRPDTLLMHNTLHDDCIEALEKYKKLNRAFVVFGQDDLMFALPPKNPFSKTVYRDIKKRIRRCLSLADRLVVTTEALAAGLRGMSDDIRVVPNYLDDTIWQDLRSKRNAARKPRVGWAGAQQHLGDLEMIEQVVKETANEVDWVFFGMCPDCLRPYAKEVHDAVRFEQYPEKLAALNLDLAVAPLEHNRFNEAKSNLRLLEYGVLGWPVVASDIEPYRDTPVCLVRNQPRAWITAIRERVHDIESAWQEGDRLRDWVRQNWMLSQHLAEWESVLGRQETARGDNSVRVHRATA